MGDTARGSMVRLSLLFARIEMIGTTSFPRRSTLITTERPDVLARALVMV
jgi:hypothetical protein